VADCVEDRVGPRHHADGCGHESSSECMREHVKLSECV
jgi:hypothetical protein